MVIAAGGRALRLRLAHISLFPVFLILPVVLLGAGETYFVHICGIHGIRMVEQHGSSEGCQVARNM